MEEEKKKKRNKKKKSKQNNHTNNNKAPEDDVSVGAATNNNSNGQNHGNVNDNQVIEVSSNGDVVDAEDFNGHYDKPKGTAPHSPWLKRETALQETIKHLQNETDSLTRTQDTFEETIKRLRDENDSHIQKEATLEETVKQLQNESASHTQKEASLEDTINQLRSVNNLCIQKEATFEDTIKQLKTENDSHLQKEADLEKRIVQLQSEKDFWLQKEAGFGEKLNHLQDEKAALVLKAASIGEKIRILESDKDSWTLSENTTKETIARMNIDITRLRMQVVELEDSRNSLVKENQQLKESISDLKLQLQNINTSVSFANTSELGKPGAEKEELNSQIEAACALVNKLITENADLVEKVMNCYSAIPPIVLNQSIMEMEFVELFDEAKKAADASLNDDVSSSGPEVTRCVDSLKQLRKFKVTSELLVSTQVGKKLRPLAKHPKEKIRAVASDLLEMWKKIVIDETRKKNGSIDSKSSVKLRYQNQRLSKLRSFKRLVW
ncbi:protein hook [Populus alba x Populus x berolinensis]|nr:protein hook [Populus alba x Populus x berolinensis]